MSDNAALHIGNNIDAKEAAGPLADAVIRVLAAIGENHIDRESGLKALDVVAMSGTTPTHVSNCTFGKMPTRGTWQLYSPLNPSSDDED